MKEKFIGIAITFLAFGFFLGFIELILNIPLNETVYALLGISLFFYAISYFMKSEKKEWICQKCDTTLVREQIKFGLCPVCGTKVKDFRGMGFYGGMYNSGF